MECAVYNVRSESDLWLRAQAVSRTPGVEHVTVDPMRRQLVVRFARELRDSAETRELLRARAPARGRWVAAWPYLARLPGAVAALV